MSKTMTCLVSRKQDTVNNDNCAEIVPEYFQRELEIALGYVRKGAEVPPGSSGMCFQGGFLRVSYLWILII